MFKTQELTEFWTVIDEVCREKKITWTALVGGNVNLAVNKTLNPTLKRLLQMEEILGIRIIDIAPYEPNGCIQVEKDPETANKMTRIYRLTKDPEWVNDPNIVQQVQAIGKTIG